MDKKLKEALFKQIFLMKKLMNHVSFENNLPRGTFYLLYTIYKRGKTIDGQPYIGISVSDLSKHLIVSKPAISKTLGELEKKGWIARVSSQNDRRMVYVCITEQGQNLAKQAWHKIDQQLDELMELLGEEDVQNLIRIMGKMNDCLADKNKERMMNHD